MPNLYLTPASVSYLTQSILALVVTGYFVYRARLASQTRHWRHTALLIGFFASIALFSLLLFLETSLQRGEDLYALFHQNVLMGLALVFLLQFTYQFPSLSPRRKWEARLVLALSVLYLLWELQIAIRRFILLGDGQVIWREALPDYVLAAGLLWVPVVLLRQAITASQPAGRGGLKHLRYLWRPQGHEARAARDLALVYLIPFALSLTNIFAAQYLIPRAGYHISLSIGILIGLTAFTIVYLDHLPGTTSFVVKLVTVSLMALLAVLGTVGWVIAPALSSHYQPVLLEQSTLRFSPNAQGGYDVTSQPFYFERETGTTLDQEEDWDRTANAVDFTFPLYGQIYHQVYVSNDGAIIMGQNARYSYLHYRYGGTAPVIFPLLIDLSPEASPAGVLVHQDADRLVVTWDHMPAFYQPDAVFTFQAILYSNGVFDFSYQDIPDELVYRPNNEPGASPWVIGVAPGNPAQQVQEVDFAVLPISSDGRGIVQDYQLEFRRYLHETLAPLAYLVIGSSLLLVAGLPILLYNSLVRPLNALLHGVQQMNAGHYGVSIEVQFPDEVGFLTQSFNTMAAELGAFIADLEKRVEQRLAEIKAINDQLTRAIDGYQQAEEKLRRSSAQVQILHEIDQAILGAQSPQTIAQSILGRLPNLIPCRRVSVVEFTADAAEVLAVETRRGFGASINSWLELLHQTVLKQPRIQGVANIQDLSYHTPLQEAMLAHGICAYVIVPLLAQGQVVGALTIENDQADAFTAEHVDLSAQIGSMLALAIHQAQLRISLQQRTQELQAQNAELDAFAHTVAHDLKNPIGIVASGAQLLVNYGTRMSVEELRETAQMTSRGAFNAAKIVDNLLLLANTHKVTIEPQPIDMASVVGEAMESLQKTIDEYQAEVIMPPLWPQAMGYAPWVVEVWANYMSNAIKYGGRPPRVELGASEQADGTIRFWVRDNGHGLTPAEQARLFTPFERLGQDEIKGHGLGLSIVRRIVDKLGGRVGIESVPGQGSLFYFTLPAMPSSSQDMSAPTD